MVLLHVGYLPGNLPLLHGMNGLPAQLDVPGGGVKQSRHTVEQGALSSTVWP